MKNIAIGVVGTILVILAIVGFSTLVGGDEVESREAVTAPAPRVTEPDPAPADKDEVFVTLVRSELPDARFVSDADLVEAGKLTCETIEMVGLERVLGEMLTSDVDQNYTVVMVAASLAVYCPELTPPDWDEEEFGV